MMLFKYSEVKPKDLKILPCAHLVQTSFLLCEMAVEETPVFIMANKKSKVRGPVKTENND